MTGPYRFQRSGRRIPARYHVHTPADYVGDVEAVFGRAGQSRSTNLYLAFPATRRGEPAVRPLHEPADRSPHLYSSRRAAADALLDYHRRSPR